MKGFLLVVVVIIASTLVESEESNEVKDPKINYPMIQPRIIGGSTAANNAFPYQAYLTMYYQFLLLFPIKIRECGGSIIAENWVLTAAHCIDPQTEPVPRDVTYATVKAGGGATKRFRQSKTVKSENFYKNPDYRPEYRYNDFALLKTDSWNFGDPYVQPIKIPPPSHNINQYTGKIAVASGYGPTSYDNPDGTSTTLQYIELIILSETQCYPQFGRDMPISAFCAQDPRTPKGSACNSDFGGPLALTENGKTILIGVGSVLHYKNGCDGTAQGYQMVAYVTPWITSKTGITV